MNYPEPVHNGYCQCRRNPAAAFLCPFGHLLECHFPYSCKEAACTHLRKYDYTDEQIEQFERQAREAITRGLREPYELDESGNIVIRYAR